MVLKVRGGNCVHFVFNAELIILRHYLLDLLPVLVSPLHVRAVVLFHTHLVLLLDANWEVDRVKVAGWHVVDILRLADALLL